MKPAPITTQAKVPFDGQTNYRQDFSPKQGEVRKPFKPAETVQAGQPFDGTSTTRADYVPHIGAERAVPVHRSQTASTLPEDRTFATEASANFKNLPAAVRKSFKPDIHAHRIQENRDFKTEARASFHPFDGAQRSASCKPPVTSELLPENRDFKTETHANFDNKGIAKVEPVRPPRTTIENLPFDGTTTTRADFKKFDGVKPAESCKPKGVAGSNAPENRDFVTENRGHFTQKPIPKREPYPNKEVYNPSKDDRDFATEVRANMKKIDGDHRRAPIKPSPTVQPNLPFDAASTHALDYHPHPAAVRKSFKPDVHAHRVQENRDFKTEARASFHPFDGAERAVSCKPQSLADLPPENRDFKTETRANFDNKGYAKAEPVRPPRITIEKLPFDGTTTTRADFHRFDGVKPSESCKPKLTAGSNAPENRDFVTENRGHFTPKPLRPRAPYPNKDVYNPTEDDRDFTTELRANMKKFEGNHRREPIKPSPTVQPNLPFDGASVHALDYHPHPTSVRKSFKPDIHAHRVPENRDFKTETRASFHPFDGAQRAISFKPSATADLVPENRDFKTETHANFDNKGIAKVEPVRPPRTTIENLPFDGTTTTRADFKKFEGVKPSESCKPKKADAANAPENRDFITENRGNFNPKPIPQREPYPNKEVFNPSPEDRDFTTEVRANMKKIDGDHRRMPTKPSPTVQPNLPFDAASTHALDFHAHPTSVRKSFKPDIHAHRIDENRDFGTDYRVNYHRFATDIYASNMVPHDTSNLRNSTFRYLK